MSYVEKILSEDEKLIRSAYLHWIYMAKGFSWFFLFAATGIIFDYVLWETAGRYVSPDSVNVSGYNFIMSVSLFEWVCIGGGVAIFLIYYLKYISTEIVLTDKRILYKTGFIAVRAEELDLQEIREEKINHGWFGYFLDYGKIHLDCRFVRDLDLPEIADPTTFMKALYKERARHSEDAIT